jgi:hypothetical protein
MIIWLASYPKTGNTWIRTFISSIIFSKDGISNFNNLEKIPQYPMRRHFHNLIENFQNINEIKKNWIISQDKMNLDNKIKFIKTHHVNCKIGTDSFTNLDNTKGVIYIVRDPRNVVTSIKNHFSLNTYEDAKKFIFDDHRWLGFISHKNKIRDNKLPTLISSWSTNYKSWKNMSENFLLIKYEDLLMDPDNEFAKIVKFLSSILNIEFNKNIITEAIKTSSFDNLKKLEKSGLFGESVADTKSGDKKDFFYLGPKNDWKKLLDNKISKEIEQKFQNEMKELKYLG